MGLQKIELSFWRILINDLAKKTFRAAQSIYVLQYVTCYVMITAIMEMLNTVK